MTDDLKIKRFVDAYIEDITTIKHIEKSYKTLQERRLSIIRNYNLDINKITALQIVKYIKGSKHIELFKNINLNKAANVIFLKKIKSPEIIKVFEKMTDGMNETNYLQTIYTKNKLDQEIYSVFIEPMDYFFKECQYYLKFELMSNMATFIEAYYQTYDGKKFIEGYKYIKDISMSSKQYFKTFFKKMNAASINPLFYISRNTTEFVSNNFLSSFFVLIDKSNKIGLYSSISASHDVKLECVGVLKNFLTSKIIADAILEEIDLQIIENKNNVPFYNDNSNDIQEMRTYYWNQMIKSDPILVEKDKYKLIGNALIRKIKKHNLLTVSDNILTTEALTTGITSKELTVDIYNVHPIRTINKILGKNGNITKKKIQKFFSNKKDVEIKLNFINNVKELTNLKTYKKSELNDFFNKSIVNMNEFKLFLQNSTFKYLTLDKYNGDIDKPAINFFYNNVTTKRSFTSVNQEKINIEKFTCDIECLFYNMFLLPDKSTIDKHLVYLNEVDCANIRNHLLYTILTGISLDDNPDESPVWHIIEHLDTLKLNISPIEFLKKIRMQYKLEIAYTLEVSATYYRPPAEVMTPLNRLKKMLDNNEISQEVYEIAKTKFVKDI